MLRKEHKLFIQYFLPVYILVYFDIRQLAYDLTSFCTFGCANVACISANIVAGSWSIFIASLGLFFLEAFMLTFQVPVRSTEH